MNRQGRRRQESIDRRNGKAPAKVDRLNWEPWPAGDDWAPWLERMVERNPHVLDLFTRLRLPAARALSPERVAALGEAIMVHLQARLDALTGVAAPADPKIEPSTPAPECRFCGTPGVPGSGLDESGNVGPRWGCPRCLRDLGPNSGSARVARGAVAP